MSNSPTTPWFCPGGESTAQAKMLRELGMLDTLKSRVAAGLPVLGTCAGLILLAQNVEEGVPAAGDPNGPVAAGATAPGAIGTLPVTVRRNAYGRQLGSFRTIAPVCGFARRTGWRNRRHPHDLHPRPVHQGGVMKVPRCLARVDDRIAAVCYGKSAGRLVPSRIG